MTRIISIHRRQKQALKVSKHKVQRLSGERSLPFGLLVQLLTVLLKLYFFCHEVCPGKLQLRHEKTCFLPMCKQGCRSAVWFHQCLCFHYIDSTTPLLPRSEISNLLPSSVAIQPVASWISGRQLISRHYKKICILRFQPSQTQTSLP